SRKETSLSKAHTRSTEPFTSGANLPVIRIDNLPWDVTPEMLSEWLVVPADRIHILLERATGKTLSHCFVELSLQNARIALRTCQNKIIGNGRRTRAVSVTVSSQEELMAQLFPNWRGIFKSSQPSVEGLDQRRAKDALKCGLLSSSELDSLMNLLNNPEAIPTLPFHALISILQKFPAPSETRAFWTSSLRDRLFAVVQAAMQILAIRVSQQGWDAKLLNEVEYAAVSCLDAQRRLVTMTAEVPEPSLPLQTALNTPHESNASLSPPSELVTPSEYIDDLQPSSYFQPKRGLNGKLKANVTCPPDSGEATSPGVHVMEAASVCNSPRARSRSVFQQIGDDVGADPEVVKKILQRLFTVPS
ncbi:hypothetical protein FRB99_007192, partial [Tulasnella sp. 403]